MLDGTTTVESLKSIVGEFVARREWQKYHNPKDLAISLSLESAELLEIFQWKDRQEIDRGMSELMGGIEEELADIAIYMLSFCIALDIDLSKIVTDKVKRNEEKYPADMYKGKASL
ncbi:MAG: nucleotide pyrophosphohydrolase [Thermoplasmata archaeon]|nr:nucleotide pyrophosphohydrolase [Thermoplasmata archaeon]